MFAQYCDLRSWALLVMKAAVKKGGLYCYTQRTMRARGLTQDSLQVVRLFEDMTGIRWTHPQ